MRLYLLFLLMIFLPILSGTQVLKGNTFGLPVCSQPPAQPKPFCIEDLVLLPFGRSFLTYDAFFTNTDVTYGNFLSFFTNTPNNRFTSAQKGWIYVCSKRYQLNPFVALIRLEQEANLTWNACDEWSNTSKYEKRMSRAMGYALHLWDSPSNATFSNQVQRAMMTFRIHFDSWAPGKMVKWQRTHLDQSICIPRNAATWALYSYSPAYGKCVYPWYNNLEEYGNAVWCIVQKKMFDCLPKEEVLKD